MRLFQPNRSFQKPAKAAKPLRKPIPAASSFFEPLEGRQMMSASTISAVNFTQSVPVSVRLGNQTIVHHINQAKTAVFSIRSNNSVSETTGAGTNINLGGAFTQISAGLDRNGNPEVYGIAADGSVSSNDNGAGWHSLGGTARQVSASVNGTVFAIGNGNNVYENTGSGWTNLGGNAKQISAGVDPTFTGKPEVYDIDSSSNSVKRYDGGSWLDLGGQAKEIAGTAGDSVYAIGENNAVFVSKATYFGLAGWQSLGGQATDITAGLDASGQPEVFATGLPATEVFVNDGQGWVDLKGSGVEISGPSYGPVVPNNSLGVVGVNGQTFVHAGSGFYSTPTQLDAVQLKYQQLGGPSGSLGLATNYEQTIAGTKGSEQVFQSGTIYSSPATGTHVVSGTTNADYKANGGPQGILGFPSADQQAIAHTNGSLQYFQSGTIYSSPATGAHAVEGPIAAKFKTLGPITLGFPTVDQQSIAGTTGSVDYFQSGSIYSSPVTGAHVLSGPIASAYKSNGGPTGKTWYGLTQGFPVHDTQIYTKGSIGYFQNVKAIADASGFSEVPINQKSLTFNSPYLTTDDAVGGHAQVTVNSDGSYALSYQFDTTAHFSWAYDYMVTITMVSPTGTVFAFTHSYDNLTGSDNGTIRGTDPRIAADWTELQGSTFTAKATANSSLGDVISNIGDALEAAGETVVKEIGKALHSVNTGEDQNTGDIDGGSYGEAGGRGDFDING